MKNVGWYASRFRAMTAREVIWRATKPLRAVRAQQTRAVGADVLSGSLDLLDALQRFQSGVDRPIFLDRQRARAIHDEHPAFVESLLSVADLAAGGTFRFFSYPAVALESPINWHYDPVADVHWPRVPSHRIADRVDDGDVKWIWELNRLQHLPWLAQAWLFTGDARYEHAAFEHLDSWINQNPPGRGIAWRGAFEAGIRAISIATALQGFRDSNELTIERFERILTILADSARRCWMDRSLFSSANNHLVGEMAGLAVVAMLFPELASSSKWEASAIRILSEEADKQILADGAGAEQAIDYQIFTVELLLVVAALLFQRDGCAPTAIVAAIARSTSFLSAVIGHDDPAPRYGDSDEGFALRLGPEAVRSVRDHLGIVSAFNWGIAGTGLGNDTLTAEWYRRVARRVPVDLEKVPAIVGREDPISYHAPDGGLVVLRSGRRRTIMDIGPLGYLSIAAHGHADALAITLSIDGQDVISDPGTGSYHGHPEFRSVMRSTRAHATVCIDGKDQSINAGPFMWLRHAQTRARNVDLSAGMVEAEHYGYTRLPGHPVHRRWLVAPHDERSYLVVDLISGRGHHEIRASWPLHPALDAHRIPSGHIVSRGDSAVVQLLYASTAPLVLREERGDLRGNLGWWSDRLESRTPAWWLGAVSNSELPLVIASLITPMDGNAADGLTVEFQGCWINARWIEDGETHAVALPVRGPSRSRRALWLSKGLLHSGGISTFVRNMRNTDSWRG